MSIPVSFIQSSILFRVSSLLLSLSPLLLFPQSPDTEARVDSLISLMTLEEKAGQLSLFTNDWNPQGTFILDEYADYIRNGQAGGIFNAYGAEYTRKLQELAVNESRLGIPLIFGYDVIHGQKTIFPVPLAEAASWDITAIERSARIAAIEASASGLHWTFAPMCDISRDPRWGRVMEGAGEDPYLASQIAAARVRGFQGDGFEGADAIAACVKHFAAYGAVQAGREYHSVDMSERMLREIYLLPYKAAVDAGALTVMTAFNDLNGVPATSNAYLLEQILRNEWYFEGFVVSDYTSIMELMNHGVAGDTASAALLAFMAGVDMDMQSGFYLEKIPELVRNGSIKESSLDEAVRRILRVKFQLGLFDDPYRYCSVERETEQLMSASHLEASRDMARKSMVLLKNEDNRLPLDKDLQKIAIIGPLGDSRGDMIGGWSAAGEGSKAESLLEGIRARLPDAQVSYAEGCDVIASKKQSFDFALRLANEAELVILALGEPAWYTGEATSRTSLDLPGWQNELAEAIVETGKPVVAVIFNGRPLTITWLDAHVPAILEAWFPGTMAGSAIADVLFGDYNPSGKLPMTFPRTVGQIPIHYNMKNTGRPYDPGINTTSRYIDATNEPLYPFGYGLSYTTFEYGEVTLNKQIISEDEFLKVSVIVKNTGNRAGEEVVQLYIHDQFASVTRPVKELKGFQKIMLQPGESRKVDFTLSAYELAFYREDMSYGWEKGKFTVFVGANSRDLKSAEFELK